MFCALLRDSSCFAVSCQCSDKTRVILPIKTCRPPANQGRMAPRSYKEIQRCPSAAHGKWGREGGLFPSSLEISSLISRAGGWVSRCLSPHSNGIKLKFSSHGEIWSREGMESPTRLPFPSLLGWPLMSKRRSTHISFTHLDYTLQYPPVPGTVLGLEGFNSK